MSQRLPFDLPEEIESPTSGKLIDLIRSITERMTKKNLQSSEGSEYVLSLQGRTFILAQPNRDFFSTAAEALVFNYTITLIVT